MQSAKSVFALSMLLLFVAVSILGLGMSMMTDGQGHMANCPLMVGTASLCSMNIFEHLSRWQSIFTTLVPTSLTLLLALSALSLIILRTGASSRFLFNNKRFILHQIIAGSFNPLRLALSRGILHPKIYDLSLVS